MGYLRDGSYWHPLGARSHHGRPPVGALLALEFAVYRVVETTDRPEDLWEQEDRDYLARIPPACRADRVPYALVVQPVMGGKRRHLRAGGRRSAYFDVYPDEHYPVCSACGGPVPCRETEAAKRAAAAAKSLERYLTPGVCPACEEVITHRQASVRYDENTQFPGGPPVTFHAGRRACAYAARKYAETLTQPIAEQAPLDDAR